MKKQVKIGAVTYALLLKEMLPGDLTCQELAEATGLHYVTVLQYTREMHNVGVVHIARFDPDARGRHNCKVFRFGPGKDAKRVRMSDAERQQRARDRKRAKNNPLLHLGIDSAQE